METILEGIWEGNKDLEGINASESSHSPFYHKLRKDLLSIPFLNDF